MEWGVRRRRLSRSHQVELRLANVVRDRRAVACLPTEKRTRGRSWEAQWSAVVEAELGGFCPPRRNPRKGAVVASTERRAPSPAPAPTRVESRTSVFPSDHGLWVWEGESMNKTPPDLRCTRREEKPAGQRTGPRERRRRPHHEPTRRSTSASTYAVGTQSLDVHGTSYVMLLVVPTERLLRWI